MAEETSQSGVTAPSPKKPGIITSILNSFWSKLEEVDTAINSFIAKVSNGHSTLFIAAVAVAYWFIRPFFGFILSIPAKVTEILLQVLAVVVPTLINAVPYILGVLIALLIVVEIVNFLKNKK